MQQVLGDQVTFQNPLLVPASTGTPPRRLFGAEDCARFLLNDWPGTRTKKYNAAVLACVASMTGAADAESARRAVMLVFEEARVPVARAKPARSATMAKTVGAGNRASAAAG